MHATGEILLPSTSAMAVTFFAETAGVTPERYLEQSLRVPVMLSTLALQSVTPPGVLFEKPSGEYAWHTLEFVSHEFPAVEPEVAELDLFADSEPSTFRIDPTTQSVGMALAHDQNVDFYSVLNTGVVLRWKWAQTRLANRIILLDLGTDPNSLFEISNDAILDTNGVSFRLVEHPDAD